MCCHDNTGPSCLSTRLFCSLLGEYQHQDVEVPDQEPQKLVTIAATSLHLCSHPCPFPLSLFLVFLLFLLLPTLLSLSLLLSLPQLHSCMRSCPNSILTSQQGSVYPFTQPPIRCCGYPPVRQWSSTPRVRYGLCWGLCDNSRLLFPLLILLLLLRLPTSSSLRYWSVMIPTSLPCQRSSWISLSRALACESPVSAVDCGC